MDNKKRVCAICGREIDGEWRVVRETTTYEGRYHYRYTPWWEWFDRSYYETSTDTRYYTVSEEEYQKTRRLSVRARPWISGLFIAMLFVTIPAALGMIISIEEIRYQIEEGVFYGCIAGILKGIGLAILVVWPIATYVYCKWNNNKKLKYPVECSDYDIKTYICRIRPEDWEKIEECRNRNDVIGERKILRRYTRSI